MPFEDIVPNAGFLTDRQITQALNEGYLIQPNTWEAALVRRETPRLCRGGSSSLTFPGVAPRDSPRELLKAHEGESWRWTTTRA